MKLPKVRKSGGTRIGIECRIDGQSQDLGQGVAAQPASLDELSMTSKWHEQSEKPEPNDCRYFVV